MKKKQYLDAVLQEVENLKKFANKNEINKLDINWFDAFTPRTCLYGQLTGHCTSNRAKELMDKCCIVVVDTINFNETFNGVRVFQDKTFKEVKSLIKINSQVWKNNTGQAWRKQTWENSSIRNYSYLSVLESYICLKNAKVKDIINYIKGKKEKLVL